MNADCLRDADALVRMPSDRKGRFGEAICKNVMSSSGVHYIPLCEIENGLAPAAFSSRGLIVAPDFDVFGDGVSAYLDAKVKTRSVRFRNTGRVKHGIDKKNYDAYQQLGILQSRQCGLFIVELLDAEGNWSGTLLAESFAGLGKAEPGFSNQSHMVYWLRDRFAKVGSFSASDLRRIANGQKPIDMASLLRSSFGPPPPSCPDGAHNNTALWIDSAHPVRAGIIRTSCRKCGRWIGDRPGSEFSWR